MNDTEREARGRRETANDPRGPDARHGPGPSLMGASTLIANEVWNTVPEDIGSIKEFMLDMHTGRVKYAVLSYGGMMGLGLGEKLFAVPWQALTLDTANKRFTLDVSKTRLDTAPGFDKKHWPDMADPAWEASIHAYYGTPPLGGTLPPGTPTARL